MDGGLKLNKALMTVTWVTEGLFSVAFYCLLVLKDMWPK